MERRLAWQEERRYVMTYTELRGVQEVGKDASPLNLAALRIALHGWWFGQPVVPAPPGCPTDQYSYELAEKGAHTGTVVTAVLPKPVQAESPQTVTYSAASVILIIQSALAPWLGAALAGVAALESVTSAGTACTLRWPCVIDTGETWVFSGSVASSPTFTLITLAVNVQGIRAWSQPDQSHRPDRAELLIAHWLHRVEGWYRALELAGETDIQINRALAVQWLNQLEMPAEGLTILEHGQPLRAEGLTLDEQGEVVLCLCDGTRRPLPAGTFAQTT